MRATHWSGFCLLALLLVACDRERAASAPAAAVADVMEPGPPKPADAPRRTLAYEHTVTIKLAEADIPRRIDAMQQACFSQSVGACEVLDVQQRGGDHPSGSITVRVVPKGVDLLIRQAGQGGDVAERTTRAEDLAEAVADNALRRSRLEKEHARLLEFQDKPNVKLEDMLKLSERLADVEAQLDVANQQSAQQQRRIQTQLLTLQFQPPGVQAGGSEIGNALRDSTQIAATTMAGLIRVLAALVPMGLIAGVAWALWRMKRRWRVAQGD
ncbi:DUF4349 domain-containing protein [Lysobacter sp. KIS68-7]|uniref:DUF4349 domain-containing protein n=1 Tax=Lysobacter sp. KIS68-7 TaxID=2904252 RepID=UPI001E5B62D2|nr:DUF4349 domain-containing protein [Lysobacter sp. KIS68-7]UHQ18184.1 DUF4349 domain-containing protein [Lysobacter sp. KIS68-7]